MRMELIRLSPPSVIAFRGRMYDVHVVVMIHQGNGVHALFMPSGKATRVLHEMCHECFWRSQGDGLQGRHEEMGLSVLFRVRTHRADFRAFVQNDACGYIYIRGFVATWRHCFIHTQDTSFLTSLVGFWRPSPERVVTLQSINTLFSCFLFFPEGYVVLWYRPLNTSWRDMSTLAGNLFDEKVTCADPTRFIHNVRQVTVWF